MRATAPPATVRNLTHNTDGAGPARKRRRLEDLGTTAKVPERFRDSGWTRDLEYVWRMRTAGELDRHCKRANSQRRAAELEVDPSRRVTLYRSSEWHESRARAIAMPRSALVATCGKRWRTVRCGCGDLDVPVGCDQVQLCDTCSKQHWRRWRKRITQAMGAHMEAERRVWLGQSRNDRRGRLPSIYMVTFTMPHSGSIVADRCAMGQAWTHLRKIANAQGWWRTFALTWEVTPGTKGDGHVHMHMACVSSWIDYNDLADAWAKCMPGAIRPEVSPPATKSQRAKKPTQRAADYLAKYVTKGVDPGVFTGQKAGELLVAFRGMRKVTTSIGFWVPNRDRETVCRTCGQRHRSLGAPVSLAHVAPGVLLYPRGWWSVGLRRHEQCQLRVPDTPC